MNVQDTNLLLHAPEGFNCVGLSAEGAYLRVQYKRTIFKAGTTQITHYDHMDIFLNDQGREVLRTSNRFQYQDQCPIPALSRATPVPQPAGRWYRIKNGFLLALLGLQEMFK